MIKHIIEPRSGRKVPYIIFKSKAQFIAREVTRLIDAHQNVSDLDGEVRQQLYRWGLRPTNQEIDLLIANARCDWANESFNSVVAYVVNYFRRIIARVKRKFARPLVRSSGPVRLPPSSVLTDGRGRRYFRCPVSEQIFASESEQLARTRKLFDEQGLTTGAPVSLRQRLYKSRYKPAEPISEMQDFKGRTMLLNRTTVVDRATVGGTQLAYGKILSITKASDGALIACCRLHYGLHDNRVVHLFSDQLSRQGDAPSYYDAPKQQEARETD